MKVYCIIIFFILSWVAALEAQSARGSDSEFPDFVGEEEKNRRTLHEPLFPSSPPPPPLATPDSSGQDRPFFHEIPNGPTTDQGQQPPPSPVRSSTQVANSVPTEKSHSSAKKVAIATTSGVLTLALLSALAFYLCRHLVKQPDESQKLVGGDSQRFNQESILPPSTFLYIGTVEPSARSLVDETNGANASPYRKLNSGKRSERYRPSPDLQPLPPLPKPPPPPNINSPPPPMSSSDDDSHDTNFYTPQGSSVSNESPGSRHSYLNNHVSQVNQSRPDNRVGGAVPRPKRTSPKSHLLASSPDTKPVKIPSIKQSPPPPPPPPPPLPATSSLPPLQPSETRTYTPKRAQIPAPPPPRLRSPNNDDQRASKMPVPPPPPPPPPPTQPSVPRKFGAAVSKSLSPKASSGTGNANPLDGVKSSEKADDREGKDGSKVKLKPLHWDKVTNISDRATVWDQLNSSSFQLNEDAMESLFGCNSTNPVPKEATRKSAPPALQQENRVLDPKKSQNIAILLRALNVTKEEVSEALLDGNPEGLGPELLETLVKMAPTKEEEIKLKDYNGEISRLGSAERFLKAILDIPFAFKRVEAMLYRANFDSEVMYLRKSFQALEEASGELKSSRLFLKLLEAVLRTGNRMNDGTIRGDARAFKLDTLLKLVDVKGTDGKTTLLHFVVQEIIRSEGAKSDPTSESLPNKTDFKYKGEEFKKQGLQVVSGLSKELGKVKRAAGMDSDVLSNYVSKLEMGLEKVRLVMQYEKQSMQGKFFDSIKGFLKEAVEEIARIKAEERKALSSVKEVTEYFHGDAAKEEAHPFRIFMIVRDFLSILDNVCRDVGMIQDRATMGAGRSFRMPVTASFPVLNRYNQRRDRSSDDDSM